MDEPRRVDREREGRSSRGGRSVLPSVAADPANWDVVTTRLLGRTVLRPFWRGWVRRLGLQGGERVLDYGSGSGQLSRRLALAVGATGTVTCLDISPRWLAWAAQETADLPWVDVRLGTLAMLPPHVYDLAHVHYVLHAVPRGSRGAVVEEAVARLAPRGRLAVREPLYYGTLHLDEVLALGARVGLRVVNGPARRWWLAGPVVEVIFARSERDDEGGGPPRWVKRAY